MKRKTIRNKLDKVFSLIIREYGSCEKCGKRDGLQCAHIFSRSNLAVRWDTDNAWCLCAGCHLYWAHKNPVEFTEWTKNRMGEEKYQALRVKANTIKKWTDIELSQLYISLMRTNIKS